jgi:adenine-specific DNA-methyltransferase
MSLAVEGIAPPCADLAARKSRGAYFTPPDLSRFLAEWAIRDAEDSVLEPSCGDAVFLHAAGDRLRALGDGRHRPILHGVEIHRVSAARARSSLAGRGHQAVIDVGDFFLRAPQTRFDAVIGNPPYVRYQDFTGAARARGRAAALRAGVSLTGLASSWAAFTVHASQFLKPGGRLGLVLPAELMTVNYASEVRAYLMRRFASVRLVLFTERVFPGVLEEVVLLMAEGVGPTDHCELYQVGSTADLAALGPGRKWQPRAPHENWMASLTTERSSTVLDELASCGAFTTLEAWGDTTLGMVTGNNSYFAISPQDAAEAGIPIQDLLQLSPPGSRHLRALRFTRADWKRLGDEGKATMLFRPASRHLSRASARYVERGTKNMVDHAYKCRVRTPWWEVPLVRPAHLLFTYMNADSPRLCTNSAGVHHLNSVHGVYLRTGLKSLGRSVLPLACLNSATLLGAELVGRSYGGGILKLEPREADRLPVPSTALILSRRQELVACRAAVERRVRAGRLAEASAIVDDALLDGADPADVRELREARNTLSSRRRTRGATQL